jgi:hypothetical protein
VVEICSQAQKQCILLPEQDQAILIEIDQSSTISKMMDFVAIKRCKKPVYTCTQNAKQKNLYISSKKI